MEQLPDIDSRSLRTLEWDRLCSYLAVEARSTFAREKCLSLSPYDEEIDSERALDETEEALSLFNIQSPLLTETTSDLREVLKSVSARGSLSAGELLRIRQTLESARRVKSSLGLMMDNGQADETPFPRLCAYHSQLFPIDDLRREIERCIDEEGEIKDEASSELRSLRNGLRKLHNDIRLELNRLIHSSNISKALQEPIYTQRGGRYVLPVDASKRGTVDGIVHDSSQSGLTVYVEPMSIVEPTNRIRIKESEIEREIERIIAQLCAIAHQHGNELEMNFLTLTQLDVICARARLALKYKGIRPELSHDDSLVLVSSRHPLLSLQGLQDVIPNDLQLGGGDRTLVITGPNTGGKTVLLKQIGLMALMVKAGLLIPVKAGSKIPIVRKVWADIGDEQSLVQSLSTFSSHMQNIVAIIGGASAGMLILLDEIGVGTDPKEGAALARAVLEFLNKSGAITVTTTHYGELKMLAYQEPGFVNGSLDFDETNLAPTYKLRMGVAGSSKATTISLRLGLNLEVVNRANSLLEGKEEELGRAMDELERRLQKVSDREQVLQKSIDVLSKERSEFERQRVESQSETEEKRRQFAAQIKSEFETASELIKSVTRELQSSPSSKGAQEARQKLEVLRKELGWIDPQLSVPSAGRIDRELAEGQSVKIVSLNKAGVIESIVDDGGKKVVTVQCENMRIKVGADDVVPFEKPRSKPAKPSAVRPSGARPSGAKSYTKVAERGLEAFIRTSNNTLDLRGQRVDAAVLRLEEFLDNSSLHSVSPVMIIHGHGTGAVKSAVRENLTSSTYISSFRPGEQHEGGDGVTIVFLN